MKYITGVHALNLNCSLDTTGDWHQSALRWEKLTLRDTKDSIFKEYGLEYDKNIPGRTETFCVANHIRAILDLIEEGKFSLVKGMRDNFICNEKYTLEVFNKVIKLKNQPNWNEIHEFMRREYFREWSEFERSNKS